MVNFDLFYKLGLDLQHDKLSKETLEKVFKTKTRDEWDAVFSNVDACVTPVLELDEAPKHKHNVDRGTFLKLEDGTIIPRMKWLDELGLKTDDYKLPETGQHTSKIMSELGYKNEEIQKFIDNGAVFQGDISKQKSKL